MKIYRGTLVSVEDINGSMAYVSDGLGNSFWVREEELY